MQNKMDYIPTHWIETEIEQKIRRAVRVSCHELLAETSISKPKEEVNVSQSENDCLPSCEDYDE